MNTGPMNTWTRRSFLKTSIAAPAAAAISGAATLGAQNAAPADQEATPAAPASVSPGSRSLLDFGWRFHLGDACDAAKDFGLGASGFGTFSKAGSLVRAARPNFDDSSWKAVDLPHDWAVELPFVNAPVLVARGSHPLGRQYPATSIGWYRRLFDLPVADAGKRIWLEFDGIYRNSMVVFNGHYMGENFSGYAPVSFDVTDFANIGGRNVVLVRVDATLSDGWFYEGAGIYRHAWLTRTNALHVPQWGTVVRSDVGQGKANLSILTDVTNDADASANCRVISTVLDPAGNVAGKIAAAPASVPGWNQHTFQQQVTFNQPALWSLEQPNLYKLITEVEAGGRSADRYETSFGIRTIAFDADRGFSLNGKPVKIQGTCNHQDHAGVGSALPDRIQYYRIEKLKEMGCNGYRTSHNPPTPELLDACDRLGMLVMDETRMMSSAPEGLSQLDRLIRRDRNHPCVVIWSLSNEEPEQGSTRGFHIMTTMKHLAKRLDPTRPVTGAMDGDWGKGISSVVDVQGFNYNNEKIDDFHRQFPHQPSVGTETASTVSTRGIYANDKEKGYVSAYDLNYPPWASTAEAWWKVYDERPFVAGGFAWTGFDYRGEPTPYEWPCINSHFGIMDTCGFPKDNYYYYQAWWGTKPVLHLFPHWNWEGREGQEIEVWVHSNLKRVELYLNGQSLGSQDVARDSHVQWKVKYAPGTLEARGFRGGRQVLTARRETTGAAAQLVLRPDRTTISADGEDVSLIAVEIQDQQGRVVPVAGNEVTFKVAGGRLIGVGNGDPSCHESDKADKRSAFNGLCLAIVQAPKQAGDLVVDVSSAGLTPASVTIHCQATELRPAVAEVRREPPPSGPGIIGTWESQGGDEMGTATFVFERHRDMLGGYVESDFGEETIDNVRIDQDRVSFTAGPASFSGEMKGGQMTLTLKFAGASGDQAEGVPLVLTKVTK